MSLTLDQLRNAFKSSDNEQRENLPNNYYPFWKMKDGESATVRFLPDKNPDNPFGFLVEKLMHTLKINGENKSVPCLKMYDEDCPVCKVSSEFYKKEDRENGKKYWRKKQYITQALIISDPLPADETTGENHEGKVRYITLGYQLYNVIKEAFESGDLDEVPYAYVGGCDFVIKKTKQGEYSTYAVGSKFARKTSDLTEEQLAVVEENLGDLSELLPSNPGLDKVQGMLEAALTGDSYGSDDAEGQVVSKPKASGSKFKLPTSNDDVDDNETSSSSTSSVDSGDDEADDILKQIRARRAAAQN